MHYSIIVILKKGQELEKAMAPFYEGVHVPEYERDCYCLNTEAQRDVNKKHDFDDEVRRQWRGSHKNCQYVESASVGESK